MSFLAVDGTHLIVQDTSLAKLVFALGQQIKLDKNLELFFIISIT